MPNKQLPTPGNAASIADILPMLMQALSLQQQTGMSGEPMMAAIEQARLGNAAPQLGAAQAGLPTDREQMALLQRFSQGQNEPLPGGPAINIPAYGLYEADKWFGQNVLGQPGGPAWEAMTGVPGSEETTSKASMANFLMSALGSLSGGN